MIAFGVSLYTRGAYDGALQCLGQAADANPDDPGPYLFLGKMLNSETVRSQILFERLEGFARSHPENAVANYNYAVALQLHDYERAYGYLAEKDNKPTYNAFHQAFLTRQLDTGTTALQIGNVQMLENGEAWVSVTIQFAGNGIEEGCPGFDAAFLVFKECACGGGR